MSEQTVAQDEVSALAAQLPGQVSTEKEKGGKRKRGVKPAKEPRVPRATRPVKVRERRQYDAGAEARLTYSVCAALLIVGAVAFWWFCIR